MIFPGQVILSLKLMLQMKRNNLFQTRKQLKFR